MNSVTTLPVTSFADVCMLPLDVWGSVTQYFEKERDLLALFRTCTYMYRDVQRASFLSAPDLSARRWLWFYRCDMEKVVERAGKVEAGPFLGRVRILDFSVKPHDPSVRATFAFCVRFDQIARHMPSLSEINMEGCITTIDGHLEAIARVFPKVEHLNIAGCYGVSDEGIEQLAHCAELRTLDMRGCKKVTNASLLALSQGMPHLCSLDVSNCLQVGDTAMIPFVTAHTRLSSLGLSRTGISDMTLRALSEHCPNLFALTLTLDSCDVSDDGLLLLAQSHRKWQHLSLSGCGRVSKGALLELIRQGDELVSLALNQTRADDSVLVAIQTHCRALRSLAMGDCVNSTQEGLLNFAKDKEGFFSLQHLDVSNLALTDETLIFLGAKCPYLRSIDLSYCEKISGSGVKAFLRHCPSMHSLTIRNIVTLSGVDVEAWLKACPTLQYINLGTTPISTQRIWELVRDHEVKIDYSVGVNEGWEDLAWRGLDW